MSTAPVTIVTGGLSGLGADIVAELVRRGHRVYAFGLESDATDAALSQQVLESGGEWLVGDVTDQAQVEAAVARVSAQAGRIDGLVNNAAIGPLATVTQTSGELWDQIMAVNVKGAFLFARSVIPLMRDQGGGAIVNVGSGAGWGKAGMAAYAASKGALHALTMAMAYDHFHDHVRVNLAIPGGGGIRSGMSLGRVGGDESRLGRGAPGSVAGRRVAGRDLANAVAFLLSADAETISGTVIDVGCFAGQGGPIPSKPVVQET
jgi:NAD(P)-dependent dehydrogenase (short-subunit alcohol dehydrogenase family)